MWGWCGGMSGVGEMEGGFGVIIRRNCLDNNFGICFDTLDSISTSMR